MNDGLDELHPAALCTPTTMRTSVLTIIDLKLGQPHIVHGQGQRKRSGGATFPWIG